MGWPKKKLLLLIPVIFLLALPFRPTGASPPAGPLRIVCFAPSGAEILYALQAQNLLVGVSDFCVYPPSVKKIPRVGGFYNPNLERVAALMPDLVIVEGHHDKVADFCNKRGIPVHHLRMDKSISGIKTGIMELGKIAGKSSQAAALWAGIEKDLAKVKKAVSGLARKKVFACVGRSPDGLSGVTTASGNSFVGEIISIAGGINVFSDLDRPYPEVSKESLLKRAPDFVLELRPGENLSPKRKEEIIRDWDVLAPLPAVSNRKVIVLTDDFLLLPGPRLAQAARTMARTLHPEAALP